jgi:hypothetical protein
VTSAAVARDLAAANLPESASTCAVVTSTSRREVRVCVWRRIPAAEQLSQVS